MKRISIIVSVYNKEQFIRRCLDSIYRQMNKEVEVIVIDDGSTDMSRYIVDEYKPKGFRVYHQKNKGVSGARNAGLKKAKGEFITFMDADDSYCDGAIDILLKYTNKNLPIIQFGQYRWKNDRTLIKKDVPYNRYFSADALPKRWMMVWNKLYRGDLIRENNIQFKEGLQFCEDELFNLQLLLITKGLKHAPHTLVNHYFDDHDSLCRGNLNLDRIMEFDRAFEDLIKEQKDQKDIDWLTHRLELARETELYRRHGYGRTITGKYDIVYCLKETWSNEELRYSLRSVEENWKYRNVVFAGGCPHGITPDFHLKYSQTEPTKWERVRNMLLKVCDENSLTEDFWLFNDDFYILKPVDCENMKPLCNGTIQQLIDRIEKKRGGIPSDYTARLKHMKQTLEDAGLPTVSYAVHKPMLFNRKKFKEVLKKFPNEPFFRSLYGNYWQIGGEHSPDNKLQVLDYKKMDKVRKDWTFLSSADRSFREGNVGEFIRERFNTKSRFEK